MFLLECCVSPSLCASRTICQLHIYCNFRGEVRGVGRQGEELYQTAATAARHPCRFFEHSKIFFTDLQQATKGDEKHATLHNAVSAHRSAESGCNIRAL